MDESFKEKLIQLKAYARIDGLDSWCRDVPKFCMYVGRI